MARGCWSVLSRPAKVQALFALCLRRRHAQHRQRPGVGIQDAGIWAMHHHTHWQGVQQCQGIDAIKRQGSHGVVSQQAWPGPGWLSLFHLN